MLDRARICLVVGILIFLVLSCAKLPESPSPMTQSLTTQKLLDEASIPKEWGTLISVSASPIYQSWLQLWFQDKQGTIRMVPFNIETNKLNPNIRILPRT